MGIAQSENHSLRKELEYFSESFGRGAGEMAQQVRSLLCRLEDLSSDPQHSCGAAMPDTLALCAGLVVGQRQANPEGSLASLAEMGNFRFPVRDPISKTKKVNV